MANKVDFNIFNDLQITQHFALVVGMRHDVVNYKDKQTKEDKTFEQNTIYLLRKARSEAEASTIGYLTEEFTISPDSFNKKCPDLQVGDEILVSLSKATERKDANGQVVGFYQGIDFILVNKGTMNIPFA